MACISVELAIAMLLFAAALILLREYQNMRSIKLLKDESDELRDAIYALQKEEKNFRERDFRKLLNDFNKLKERADEHESENIKLKKTLGKNK
jgi:predicted nuclease with TOPRIM domain